jgi:hypothetical protein
MNKYKAVKVIISQNNCDGKVEISICGRPADSWPSAQAPDKGKTKIKILRKNFIMF